MFGRIISLTILALTAHAGALAQSQDYDVRADASQLTGEALRAAFTGVTHTGAYNFNTRGEPGNRYTEWHGETGEIIYREGTLLAKGKWTATRDMICYEYQGGDLGSGCFRVYKLGSCHYFYSARAALQGGDNLGGYWTARSTVKGKRATCEDMIS